jgi:hypothetical protein
MPSSRPNTIPLVIHFVREMKPKSILDVGIGFGKWGHLFREYTDILGAEHDPKRYERKNWQVRIDGIEGHTPYLTEMHRFLYNEIHVGDARELIKRLPNYDLIFMGDIIEHFDKEQGMEFLRNACEHALKAVILTTPKYETDQEDLCGNELERHRSLWSADDFKAFSRAAVETVDGSMLVALLPSRGLQKIPSAATLREAGVRIRQAQTIVKEIIEMIPRDEKFALVDEEQIRSLLPHPHVVPFLQKDGKYWGAPPDEQTAIRELEESRMSGATMIVFIAPCFWWLEYYTGFHRYLTDRFPCKVRNPKVIIFDLTKSLAQSGSEKSW